MSWFTDRVADAESRWNTLGGVPKRWVVFVAGVVCGIVGTLILHG